MPIISVCQSGTARTIVVEVGFRKARVSDAYMYNHQMCGCTLNVYGSDAEYRETWGVENTPVKSGSLFALHTDTLSFIGTQINFYWWKLIASVK